AAGQLLKLVDDFLDLAKIEADKVELDLRSFALGELIDEVCTMAVPLSSQRGNTLTLTLAPDLGTVVLDRARVGQVLLNLVGNAAKFTEKGQIEIRASRSDGQVQIEVRDTGIGIAPDRLPTLFQPFVQATGSTEPRPPGTGLGLAISAQL